MYPASMKILGIAGSLRKTSYNAGALRAAQQLAPAGSTIDIFDLSPIPVYNQDLDPTPPAVITQFKSAIRAADAILICTPEYNYSVPGVLKNAIDWASRPYGDSAWLNKPIALMGASVGMFGTARAQYHLRQSFVFLDAYVLNQPEVMIANASQRFDGDGNLTDEKTKELIKKQLDALVAWAKRLAT